MELLNSVNELFKLELPAGNDILLASFDFLFAISSNFAPREPGPYGEGMLWRLSFRFDTISFVTLNNFGVDAVNFDSLISW